ncbi:ribosomal protein S18-alanine N-acetyltransferase [Paracidovorax citrulli]
MPTLPAGSRLERMSARDLDAVVDIEQRAYPHPWSRGNFENSLKAGHIGLTLRDAAGALNSYAILMPVVDEMHLLNLTVEPQLQRRGLGRLMLNVALAVSHEHRLPDMLLEVRPSNTAALALYHATGFVEIGRRRGYYPADDGGREDALVLRRDAPRADSERHPGESA